MAKFDIDQFVNEFVKMHETIPDGECELCHKPDQELRPYGPNNENICFECGMKDEPTTRKKVDEVVLALLEKRSLKGEVN